MKYYIYAYLDPRKEGHYKYGDYTFEHEPFYIGRGKGRRMYSHINEAKRDTNIFNFKLNKIRKIWNSGLDPILIKIIENLEFEESVSLEREVISYIGRVNFETGPLVNMTDGGEGSENPSEEILQKISAYHKGKIVSEESRRKMSQSHLGYEMPQDVCEKIAGTLTGIQRSKETKDKLSRLGFEKSVERAKGRIINSIKRMVKANIEFSELSYSKHKQQTTPRYKNIPKYFSPEKFKVVLQDLYSRH